MGTSGRGAQVAGRPQRHAPTHAAGNRRPAAHTASASEHAKVLREVYLIETLREGRAVRHSLTALGRTMLGQLQTSPRGERASRSPPSPS